MSSQLRVNPAFSLALRVRPAAVATVRQVVAQAPGAAIVLLDDPAAATEPGGTDAAGTGGRADGAEGASAGGAGDVVAVTVEADGGRTLRWLQAELPRRLGDDLLALTDLAFSVAAHGKVGLRARASTATDFDLALLDADADRRVVTHLAANPRLADRYTGRSRRVALLSDGTAVLDLEPLEATTALPALESQALLLHRASSLDVIPLPVAARRTADLVSAIELLSPGFGATVLVFTDLRRVAAVRQALAGTGLVVLDAVNDGLAVAAAAAALSTLRAAGIRPGAARVVLVDPARGGDLSSLLVAAGVGDITLYDPVAFGIDALHRLAADGAADLIVDLVGLAAPPTTVPVLRTRPQAPPPYAAATTAPRPLHALPGLLTAALAAHRSPTIGARLAAADALVGLAEPGQLLPPLDHPRLAAAVTDAAAAVLPTAE